MPLYYIRNDIVRVSADVIVNSANPNVFIGGGTDRAIYTAAGEEELFQARKLIGDIDEGDVRFTDAYKLDAKYIFHTVAPAWKGGNSGEETLLQSCYENCLALVKKLGCESIAFPLLATGILGFPKDLALRVAMSTIQNFLFAEDKDYDITIVVFDDKSFQLSKKLTDSIDQFISDDEFWEKYEIEYKDSKKKPISSGSALPGLAMGMATWTVGKFFKYNNVEEAVNTAEASFQECLFSKIDKRGGKDSEVYKRAGVTRKVFSDIKNNKNYHPKKSTAIAFALALELDIDEATELLETAGYSLTASDKRDRIVVFCIQNHTYSIIDVDAILYEYDCQPLNQAI